MTSTALADLVRAVQESGVSYREMMRRAEKHGHSISHSQLSAYANNEVRKTPSEAQIAAIAAATGRSVTAVRDAVMEQYLDYTAQSVGQGLTVTLPRDVSDDERDEVQRLVDAWLAARGKAVANG